MKQLSLINKRNRKKGVKLGRPATTFTGARQKRMGFSKSQALHITLRLRDSLPNLRSRRGAQTVKNAISGARKKGLRVIHFSILSNHLHLICEAISSKALFNAMKSFTSRLAISIRRWASLRTLYRLDEEGVGIFRGRYHTQIIKTPTQMKQALKYVLLNPAKHFKKAPYLDLYSSGVVFSAWKRLIGNELFVSTSMKRLEEKLGEFLSPPELWLTQSGWWKAKH